MAGWIGKLMIHHWIFGLPMGTLCSITPISKRRGSWTRVCLIPTSTSLSFFLVWCRCWFVVHVRCFILCVFPVMCSHLLVCPVLCFLVCSIYYFDTFLVLTYVSLQNCSTVIDNGVFKHCDPRMPWMGNQQVYWSFSPDVSLRKIQTGYMASSMVVGVASIPAGVSLSLCGCSVTQTHVWSNFDEHASIWVNWKHLQTWKSLK